MKTASIPMLRLIGMKCQGDIGDMTCYTSRRNKVVWFLKSPPKEPPSFEQQEIRQKFSDAGEGWRALSDAERNLWNLAAQRANLRITGYNLWVYFFVKLDWWALRTIENQTGITLVSPFPPDLQTYGVPNH